MLAAALWCVLLLVGAPAAGGGQTGHDRSAVALTAADEQAHPHLLAADDARLLRRPPLTRFEDFSTTLFLGADPACDGRAVSPCYWSQNQQNDTLAPPRWQPRKNLTGVAFHEFAVGEAPKSCIANKWLFFIGDSVTRETLYALMTLNGAPPWVNFSVSEEVWRRDIPPAYEIDREGTCKGWNVDQDHAADAAANNTQRLSCFRDWTESGVRYTFVFLGLLEHNLYLPDMLQFGDKQPDALFVNHGIWPMVLRKCDIAYYGHSLHSLLHMVRSAYKGKLYWLGQSRPNWGMSCYTETMEVQMRALDLLGERHPERHRIVPIDRMHLAGNFEHPQWYDFICFNATKCMEGDAAAMWPVTRDLLHPSLTVQTAIAQHILNLLCEEHVEMLQSSA